VKRSQETEEKKGKTATIICAREERRDRCNENYVGIISRLGQRKNHSMRFDTV